MKWTIGELQQMNQKTKKLMTVHKALHQRDNIDTLYELEKNEETDSPALKI